VIANNALQVTTQRVPSVAWLDKLINKQTTQTCTDSLPLKKSTYYHKNKWEHEHVVLFSICCFFGIHDSEGRSKSSSSLLMIQKELRHICNVPFLSSIESDIGLQNES
jgi:ribosomal 30S subunit maturation factor RimM